ncbi:TPA: hypothetical protein DEP21_03565 [Patescibacteria group bacterium]|nr:hypothetical protein [Candidatus Gracilibacteria bacterium]
MNKNTPQESVQNTKNMDLLGNYIVKSQEDISNILCKKMPALENIHKTYSFVFMELVQNILKH